MSAHLIRRVTVLGTGLIGGSFALALKKHLTDIHVSGWDRPEVVREKATRSAFDETFSGNLQPAVAQADLIYIALPISVTLDLLPEIASHAPHPRWSPTLAAPNSASLRTLHSFFPAL